jgi:hypothetical protein
MADAARRELHAVLRAEASRLVEDRRTHRTRGAVMLVAYAIAIVACAVAADRHASPGWTLTGVLALVSFGFAIHELRRFRVAGRRLRAILAVLGVLNRP